MTKAKSHYYDAQIIQIIYDFLLKWHYYDARKNWKKHVLKTSKRKNHTTMMPTNTDILCFFVKITILWYLKILKKHALNTSPKNSHTTMMPKKYGYLCFCVKITLLWSPKKIENKMWRHQYKIALIGYPKTQKFAVFFGYQSCVILPWRSLEYMFFSIFLGIIVLWF